MDKIAEIWNRVQRQLFPHLEECEPSLTDDEKQLATVLEIVRPEEYVRPGWWQRLGRRRKDRKALARAFVAKAYYNEGETKAFINRLRKDRTLRKLCGFAQVGSVPSESTFSRVFAEFAKSGLTDRIHEALVREYVGDTLVWHVSRDSTAIEARERPVKKAKEEKIKYKRGRPKKGETRPQNTRGARLKRQIAQTAEEAISELPIFCDKGAKADSKGNIMYWIGYKFHVDIGDGGIPLSAVTTSASVHDSQVAIPLSKLTDERVKSLYDLMDSGYDADLVHEVSKGLGHMPIIAPNPRYRKGKTLEPDRSIRYHRERSAAERFNSALKDNHGGRQVRVRTVRKVHTHLMFGLLVIFAKAILGLPP